MIKSIWISLATGRSLIDEDKVSEYIAINTRNSGYLPADYGGHEKHGLSGRYIRGVVDQINADFKEKNFVGLSSVSRCVLIRARTRSSIC